MERPRLYSVALLSILSILRGKVKLLDRSTHYIRVLNLLLQIYFLLMHLKLVCRGRVVRFQRLLFGFGPNIKHGVFVFAQVLICGRVLVVMVVFCNVITLFVRERIVLYHLSLLVLVNIWSWVWPLWNKLELRVLWLFFHLFGLNIGLWKVWTGASPSTQGFIIKSRCWNSDIFVLGINNLLLCIIFLVLVVSQLFLVSVLKFWGYF
jgi:hypothetical protein